MRTSATNIHPDFKMKDGMVISKGFGLVATSLIEDGSITIGAKCLYVYLICKTGGFVYCYPSNATIMSALGIKSKLTLRDYKDELIVKNLLVVTDRKYKSGQITSNYYYPAKMIRASE